MSKIVKLTIGCVLLCCLGVMLYKQNDHSELVARVTNANDQDKNTNSEGIPLSHDMRALFQEKGLELSISQEQGEFIPTTKEFSDRVLVMLSQCSKDSWRDATYKPETVVFRFEGYEDIHYYNETGAFWFDDDEQLYYLENNFWGRYELEIREGKPIYTGFKKRIINEKRIVGQYKAVLYYDGEIQLEVQEGDILDGLPTLPVLEENYFTPEGYSIDVLDDKGLFMVKELGLSARNPFYNVSIYRLIEGELTTVWTSRENRCYIRGVNVEERTMELGVEGTDITNTVLLSQDVMKRVRSALDVIKEEGIQTPYVEMIRENLIHEVISVAYMDIDEDQEDELVLSIKYRTVGASTPKYRDRALYILEQDLNKFVFKDIILQSRNKNDALEDLFQCKLPRVVMVNWQE